MNPFALTGKLAVVTGATRGIGLGAARALAESGAGVILVGRDRARLERNAEELRSCTDFVRAEVFDLIEIERIAGWFVDLCKVAGTPDILVNSAGIQRRGNAIDLPLEDWNQVMTVNATAVFELSRSFSKACIAKGIGGRIINIASLMTAAARPGISAYTTSKGALGQLTKAMAVEWAKYDILVNAIAPGYIDTDLNTSLIADPQFDAWVKGRCPLGRWGTPADIAWPIVFLAGPAAGFITGQVIYVDGGWLATF